MALRSLLGLIEEDASAQRLAREGGHAFVSSSLRPYAIAALADSGPAERARPTLVVVGDDRAARDMAADLRAWLAPRRVRYYPSRGVAYESHLTPPPHLVGLRVAALDALLAAKRRRAPSRPSSWSARWRCRRRCPTRRCARTRSRCAWASCSTSTSAPRSSSRRGMNASSRSRSAGSSRCAAACSTCSRRPRSAR